MRTLLTEPGWGAGDCHDSWYGCSTSPPSPPIASDPAPYPAPVPSPSGSWLSPGLLPIPPVFAPSPSPVHGAGGGRRDQGRTHGYVPPPGVGGDDHQRRFVTYVLIAAAAIAFVSLILLGVSVAVRRRQVRRRRQALLAPAAPVAATDVEDGGNDSEGGGGGGGGGVVHHVWYIRTLGLDEAAIDSIAATRYRAGAGLLGAADCSVCLGEFQDGELLRLLPKCGHAFHVPCIDTWLRAHVNCPLCRSDVLDPVVIAASGDGATEPTFNPNPPADPAVTNANTEAEQAAAASDAVSEHEGDASEHREASPVEDERHEQPSPPEPLTQLPCPSPRNVRRAASMDAAIVSTAAAVAASERLPEASPEEEQSGRRKRGAKASGSGHRSNLNTDRPAAGGAPRSFFSRHCRARSSVLPL